MLKRGREIMPHMEPKEEEDCSQRDGNSNSLLGTSETFYSVPSTLCLCSLLWADNSSLNSLGEIKRGECI